MSEYLCMAVLRTSASARFSRVRRLWARLRDVGDKSFTLGPPLAAPLLSLVPYWRRKFSSSVCTQRHDTEVRQLTRL